MHLSKLGSMQRYLHTHTIITIDQLHRGYPHPGYITHMLVATPHSNAAGLYQTNLQDEICCVLQVASRLALNNSTSA